MDIYFHIGFPKCASTSLQRDFFPKVSNAVYLGIVPTKNSAEGKIAKADGFFLEDSKLRFFYQTLLKQGLTSKEKKNLVNTFNEIINIYGCEGRSLIFSHEGFLSVRFSNPSFLEKIVLLRSLISDKHRLRLLVLIRDQTKLLISLYRDIPFDVNGSFITADNWLEKELSCEFGSHASSLKYEELYLILIKYFEAENLLFVPIEKIKSNRYTYLISKFMCIEEKEVIKHFEQFGHHNKGMSYPAFKYLQISSSLYPLKKYFTFMRFVYKPIINYFYDWLKTKGSTVNIDFSTFNKISLRNYYYNSNLAMSNIIHDDVLQEYNE